MNKLQVIEHKEQRVLTTAQLAEVYETEVKNISNNFNRNSNRFIVGKDYYLLEDEELTAFKGIHLKDESLKYVSKLYLWTERGANRHCKILDTDKAWQQFDVLEETYYKAKQAIYIPKSLPEALRYAAELAETMEKQKPLVAFAETISRSEDSILIRELAKIASNQGIKIGEKRLYEKLREWGLIFKKSTEPYQEYIERDYFERIETAKKTSKGVKIFETTRVKPKGQIYIINRLKNNMEVSV